LPPAFLVSAHEAVDAFGRIADRDLDIVWRVGQHWAKGMPRQP